MNTTKQTAHKTLAAIAEVINKMAGIADDRISQIAGEENDAAARDALLIAVNDIDGQMEALRDMITRGYSVADTES